MSSADTCDLCGTHRGAYHTTEECERRQLITAVRELAKRMGELVEQLKRFV